MRLWRRLRQLLQKRSFEADLAEEVRIHREMAEASAVRAGATPEEARFEAGRDFGGTALALEDSRAVWRFAWLSSLMQDIRFGLRGFRKSPGFTLTVIGTLALGLGALGASFSVFNALVLRPFAVRDPYSLYRFQGWQGKVSQPTHFYSLREINEFRRNNPAFSEVAGYYPLTAFMAGKGARVQAVTGNYFSMLGGRVCMGRPLMESDDDPASNGVAVASYSAWRNRLGADPAAVGRTVRLRGLPVEIVGVACPEFNGVDEARNDFWVSFPLSPGGNGMKGVPSMVGRLKLGLTPEGAEAALLAYGRQTYASVAGAQRPERVLLFQAATIMPLNSKTIGTFLPEFAAFALVLLIACANVSNMMLARGLARQREIGIRISLGAGRARMVRQLLTESLLLALPAALAAFGVAYGAVQGARWLQVNLLQWSQTGALFIGGGQRQWNGVMDWRVIVFLLLAAVIATVGFGLLPALQTARSRLIETNRGEFAADRRSTRLRSVLVLAQVAVCALLLISAGVALRAERRIANQDLGMDTRGLFFVAGASKIAERVEPLPMVESIGYSDLPPLLPVSASLDRRLGIDYMLVSPEYFEMLSLPIRGRNFTRAECDAAAQVAIVSESAARRLWPRGDALGQSLNAGPVKLFGGRVLGSALVIGIARDAARLESEYGPLGDLVYFPVGAKSAQAHYLIVRTKGNAETARRALDKVAAEVFPDSGGLVSSPQTYLDAYLYPYRALAAIAAILGALALLLTISGVFGVSSYAVTQRRKEFGIRIALGARNRQVVAMVLGQTLRLGAAGAVAGGLAALGIARVTAHSDWLARAMSHKMKQLDVFDMGGYALGAAIVIAAAAAAAWIPARRAVHVDPVETLRCD